MSGVKKFESRLDLSPKQGIAHYIRRKDKKKNFVLLIYHLDLSIFLSHFCFVCPNKDQDFNEQYS